MTGSDNFNSVAPPSQNVTFTYTNHRSEVRQRHVLPVRLWFGSTTWHPQAQWLLDAVDRETGEGRTFAMRDIDNWSDEE